MSGSGEQPQEKERLGDYLVGELLTEGMRTRTYRAEQISMGRIVLMERIKEEVRHDPDIVEGFLNDVRSKAAVHHPGIGSVYEAVEAEEAVYYTREALTGASFHDLREEGRTFSPALVAGFLRQVGGAMAYLEEHGVAKLPLEPRHLVLDLHEVVRIANLAVAGHEGVAPLGHDRYLFAELCLDLLERGVPGSTRTSVLLNLMVENEGRGLTWTQVAHTARKLEQELSEGALVASQVIKTGPVANSAWRPPARRVVIGVAIGLLAGAVLVAGALLVSKRKSIPKARDLSAMVEMPGGLYLTHGGKTVDLAGFWIDAHEVTIAEYAEFLEALNGLPEEKRSGYDHPEQPTLKLDHIPDDWKAMWRAARSGGTFDGHPIDLNYAISQVDWWDAWAYASWNRARLPTQAEWFAAAQDGEVEPADRGAVDQLPGDVTPRGVHGLAGNVSEWVRDLATNPAFPMNPNQPVCCGASFTHPRDGARARTWLPTRETRRRNLGFRTARDRAP